MQVVEVPASPPPSPATLKSLDRLALALFRRTPDKDKAKDVLGGTSPTKQKVSEKKVPQQVPEQVSEKKVPAKVSEEKVPQQVSEKKVPQKVPEKKVGGEIGDNDLQALDKLPMGAAIMPADWANMKKAKLAMKKKGTSAEKKKKAGKKREAVKAAIGAGDYATFQTLTADRPSDKPEVTEAVFEKLGNLHEAREVGDKEAVKEIKSELKELGFERKGKRGDRAAERKANR